MIVLDGLNVGREVCASVGPSASMHSCDRVKRLIELLQRADSLVQASSSKTGSKLKSLVYELNALSEQYKWSPSYHVSDTGLSLSWRFPAQGSWEDTAVWWIRWLVENHSIHRLRRCSQCQTWFYAGTEHQRFCNEKCRKKHASESPIFKEKRRRYMAEVYRPREKK